MRQIGHRVTSGHSTKSRGGRTNLARKRPAYGGGYAARLMYHLENEIDEYCVNRRALEAIVRWLFGLVKKIS